MLRFGTKSRRPVRNYPSRREPLPLLALFVPLALVILLMGRLRDPKTSTSIDAIFEVPPQASPEKLRVVADSLQPRSPEPLSGLRTELLTTIEDNTYFRTAEKDAWFHFFELMHKDTPGPNLGVPVEYAQLVDQPNVYRGKLVTARGTARQITQEKPAPNDLGIDAYYRVVLQPADGASWPIIVYCLELPKGVSTGDELTLDVAVTGLFFKKLSYRWQDGLGIAPVVLAKSLMAEGEPAESAMPTDTPLVTKVDINSDRESDVTARGSTNGPATFQKILTLAGWDATRLAQFDDGESLSDAQRVEALELLHRLRSLSAGDLDSWSSNDGLTMELKNIDDVRGRLCRLTGLVTEVRQLKPAAADAERLEMPVYFECDFKAAELADPVTIITSRVPADWLRADNEYHAAAANVMFVKRMTDETPRTLWVAKEIAWYPSLPGLAPHGSIDQLVGTTSDPRFGKSLLGALNVDVGKFDLVSSRGPIRAQERDLFYETLHAASLISPSASVRIANGNLPFVRRQWEQMARDGKTTRREALAREVVRRAADGRYSVALLFNDPLPQRGRLFVFDGVARRAVRVEVGGVPNRDRESDAAKRYGIDHYYELEIFTDDSQNYPLIFCVCELPKDFPIGSNIRVPVRIAGFFFKNWLYSTRGRGQSADLAEAETAGPQAQFAPLLISHTPIVLEASQPVGHDGRYVFGGLFVLAMAGIWAAAAWFARDDRRFRERTPAANFTLPLGQSLNDLNLPVANVPMSSEVSAVEIQVSEKLADTET
jgi:hypothetical protein